MQSSSPQTYLEPGSIHSKALDVTSLFADYLSTLQNTQTQSTILIGEAQQALGHTHLSITTDHVTQPAKHRIGNENEWSHECADIEHCQQEGIVNSEMGSPEQHLKGQKEVWLSEAYEQPNSSDLEVRSTMGKSSGGDSDSLGVTADGDMTVSWCVTPDVGVITDGGMTTDEGMTKNLELEVKQRQVIMILFTVAV